jgi:hypothetical protein
LCARSSFCRKTLQDSEESRANESAASSQREPSSVRRLQPYSLNPNRLILPLASNPV